MKRFCVVSKKYTGKHHPFFTLWRPNDSGYCYAMETAGLYHGEDLVDSYHYNSPNTCILPEDEASKHKVKYLVDDVICHVLPVTQEVLALLKIEEKELMSKKPIPHSKNMTYVRDLTK